MVSPISYEKELIPITRGLNELSKVQIEAVESDPSARIKKIDASKELSGADSATFQKLWTSLTFKYFNHTLCHEPGYRIRFFEKDTLVAETTVCFHCGDIYFYDTSTHLQNYDSNFDAKNEAGMKLRWYLAKLFPGHDADLESGKSDG